MTPLALVYVATCGQICFLRSSTVHSVASHPSTSEMLPKISVFYSFWDSKRKKKKTVRFTSLSTYCTSMLASGIAVMQTCFLEALSKGLEVEPSSSTNHHTTASRRVV